MGGITGGGAAGRESEIEQFPWRDAETARNLVHGVKGYAIDPFLDIEDGARGDASSVGELFLRKPSRLAQLGDALRKLQACFCHVPHRSEVVGDRQRIRQAAPRKKLPETCFRLSWARWAGRAAYMRNDGECDRTGFHDRCWSTRVKSNSELIETE